MSRNKREIIAKLDLRSKEFESKIIEFSRKTHFRREQKNSTQNDKNDGRINEIRKVREDD